MKPKQHCSQLDYQESQTISYESIVNLIASTKTLNGWTVRAELHR